MGQTSRSFPIRRPLWHGVALCRAFSLGTAAQDPAGMLGHAAYLAVLDQMLERQIRRYTVSQQRNARKESDHGRAPEGRARLVGATRSMTGKFVQVTHGRRRSGTA
jgi:hypothetical protein